MNKLILAITILLAVGSCTPKELEADILVQKAIEASGTLALNDAKVEFSFREVKYAYESQNGVFQYTRIFYDSIGNQIEDKLGNESFSRSVNGEEITLESKKVDLYKASINSVIYFAFLPLPLSDEAVYFESAGVAVIEDKKFLKIRVTFDEQGGGEDFDDVFYYWIDPNDYSVDFLAYSYREADGVGMRFRKAYNVREIEGVFIQDYINYKPTLEGSVSLEEIDIAFQKGRLTELSRIDLENLSITKL
ncbi:MAG: DUF6503 family protein [Bacteroidota bacterium]